MEPNNKPEGYFNREEPLKERMLLPIPRHTNNYKTKPTAVGAVKSYECPQIDGLL